jgi:hypothetical protein
MQNDGQLGSNECFKLANKELKDKIHIFGPEIFHRKHRILQLFSFHQQMLSLHVYCIYDLYVRVPNGIFGCVMGEKLIPGFE